MLALVQLSALSARYPKQLSGGQQQRVALARALAVRPSILLLDEPFAALDKNLRLDMQIEIKRIQRLSGTTTLIVTHDQEEALSMADRVAVFNQGRLEQFGTPNDVYDRPASLFVNSFVGTANLLPGKIVSLDGDGANVALDIGVTLPTRSPTEPLAAGDRVDRVRAPGAAAHRRGGFGIAGVVEIGLPLGPIIVHEIRASDGRPIKIAQPRAAGMAPLAAGTPVRVAPVSRDAVTVFRMQLAAFLDRQRSRAHAHLTTPHADERAGAGRHARLPAADAWRRPAASCSRPSPAAGRRRTRTCWCRTSARPTATPRSRSIPCCRSMPSPR